MKIILASASPRRKELLEQLNIKFQVFVSNSPEVFVQNEPSEVVKELACQKAEEVSKLLEVETTPIEVDTFVVGADTIVVNQGNIMGKPKDTEDAFRMLSHLQGNTHTVYTGVSIWQKKDDGWEHFDFHEATYVTFNPMKKEEIDYYIKTQEPMDKAGAYGIQGAGAAYIKEIQGDYNNVVGLPIGRMYQEFSKRGIAIFGVS